MRPTRRSGRIGRPTRKFGRIGRPTRRFGRGREAHLEVQEGWDTH